MFLHNVISRFKWQHPYVFSDFVTIPKNFEQNRIALTAAGNSEQSVRVSITSSVMHKDVSTSRSCLIWSIYKQYFVDDRLIQRGSSPLWFTEHQGALTRIIIVHFHHSVTQRVIFGGPLQSRALVKQAQWWCFICTSPSLSDDWMWMLF